MCAAEVRVGITGFAGTLNPEPGTAVARALRQGWQGPLTVEAFGYDAWMTGGWMPGIADNLHTTPHLTGDDDVVLQRILEIHDETPLDALIPCLDLEVQVFARLAPQLAQAGIGTLLPAPSTVLAVAKTTLPTFCFDHEILTPRTIHVINEAHVAFYAEQFGYPVMIKGTVAGAKRVENAEQAMLEGRKLSRRWGGGVLVQELIAGEEYCVAMVAGRDGRSIGHVAMRKLATTSKGKGALGAVVQDPALEAEALRILEKLDWIGPLELEFIRVPSTGQLYLIEINCRFPSWVMLSHWAGCNLPVAMLSELLGGRRAKLSRAKPGVGFVRDMGEVSVPAKKLEQLQRFGRSAGTPRNGHRLTSGRNGLSVAVTGISALDVVMPGLGVARSLRLAPEIGHITGLAYGPYDTGAYRSDLFDAVYRMPDTEDPGGLLQRLRAIRDDVPIDVIIPCLDVEMPRFIAIQDQLREIGIHTLLPPAEAVVRTRKPKLFLDHNRFDWGAFQIPETYKVWTLQGVERAARTLGLPLVLKGLVSGSKTARNLDEARTIWTALRANGHEEVLAQSAIDGDEFAVAAVCGRDGALIESITIKKYLTDGGGSTWSAGAVSQPALEQSFLEFLRDLDWRGPVEGEFIRDSMSERFYLIEINPRPTAWINYSAHCGRNLPLQTVLAAAGQPPAKSSTNGALAFMRTAEDIRIHPGELAAFAAKGRLAHA